MIPALKGTAFDNITFSNVSIYHQNYQFDATKAVGWHFNADLVIDKACGALHDVLVQALGVEEPVLDVYVFLGADGGWNKPPSLHSFTLEGVFAGIAVKPIDGVVLSKIGVRIFGIRTLKYDPEVRSALEYGFSVFGTMNLDVPGSTVPLNLEYVIQESGGAIYLGAGIDTWKNPLGAKGLVVRMNIGCKHMCADLASNLFSYQTSHSLPPSFCLLHGNLSPLACRQDSCMRMSLPFSKAHSLPAAHSS